MNIYTLHINSAPVVFISYISKDIFPGIGALTAAALTRNVSPSDDTIFRRCEYHYPSFLLHHLHICYGAGDVLSLLGLWINHSVLHLSIPVVSAMSHRFVGKPSRMLGSTHHQYSLWWKILYMAGYWNSP